MKYIPFIVTIMLFVYVAILRILRSFSIDFLLIYQLMEITYDYGLILIVCYLITTILSITFRRRIFLWIPTLLTAITGIASFIFVYSALQPY
jgi:hypothetical protein